MQTLTFQNITLTPAKVDNQIWLTSAELAKALGYAETDSVTKIYNRNSDEFTSNMTTTVKMTVVRKTGKVEMDNRIFSLRGCHLIAMFARTKVAKEFRQWVLDILDKEVGQPVQVSPAISPAQRYQIQKAVKQKCLHNSGHYQTIYNALYDAFGVASYKDLLASEFDSAMAFIESFSFTPAFNLAFIQNVLTDNAYQNKKAQDELSQMMVYFGRALDHLQELKHHLEISERCITALQNRFIS